MPNATGYILVQRSTEEVRYDKYEGGLFEDIDTRMQNPKPELFVKSKLPDGNWGTYYFADGFPAYFGNFCTIHPANVLGVYPSGVLCRFEHIFYGFFLYNDELFVKTRGEVRVKPTMASGRTYSFKTGEQTAFASDIMVEPLEMRMVVEVLPEFADAVVQNDGYCPCLIEQSEDTKCPCKAFREQTESGLCHCGRYEKIKEESV